MIKHGKIRLFIGTCLLIGMMLAMMLMMGAARKSGTSREYQGAVFACDLPEGASESPWTQSSFI